VYLFLTKFHCINTLYLSKSKIGAWTSFSQEGIKKDMWQLICMSFRLIIQESRDYHRLVVNLVSLQGTSAHCTMSKKEHSQINQLVSMSPTPTGKRTDSKSLDIHKLILLHHMYLLQKEKSVFLKIWDGISTETIISLLHKKPSTMPLTMVILPKQKPISKQMR